MRHATSPAGAGCIAALIGEASRSATEGEERSTAGARTGEDVVATGNTLKEPVCGFGGEMAMWMEPAGEPRGVGVSGEHPPDGLASFTLPMTLALALHGTAGKADCSSIAALAERSRD